MRRSWRFSIGSSDSSLTLALWRRGPAPGAGAATANQLVPSGTGTRLTYTELVVMLDGTDSAAGREEGCHQLMESLPPNSSGLSPFSI